MPCGEWGTALSFFLVLPAFSKVGKKVEGNISPIHTWWHYYLFLLNLWFVTISVTSARSINCVCSFASLLKASPVQTQPGAGEVAASWAVWVSFPCLAGGSTCTTHQRAPKKQKSWRFCEIPKTGCTDTDHEEDGLLPLSHFERTGMPANQPIQAAVVWCFSVSIYSLTSCLNYAIDLLELANVRTHCFRLMG